MIHFANIFRRGREASGPQPEDCLQGQEKGHSRCVNSGQQRREAGGKI